MALKITDTNLFSVVSLFVASDLVRVKTSDYGVGVLLSPDLGLRSASELKSHVDGQLIVLTALVDNNGLATYFVKFFLLNNEKRGLFKLLQFG